MTTARPITPADHITQAKDTLAAGCPTYATAHALIAIAELLATNQAKTYVGGFTAGDDCTAEALAKVFTATQAQGVNR